jgi:plastocyanin
MRVPTDRILAVLGTAVVASAAAALLAGPARSVEPLTATVTAVDPESWLVANSATTTATIEVGGNVTFSYPGGASQHNAAFRGTPPSSCVQTAPGPSGPVPPLPTAPSGPGWAGSCAFNAPGTYEFYCEVHAGMTGRVVVVDSNAAPPPPPAPPLPPVAPAPPPPPPAPVVPSASAGARAASGLRLAAAQRGTAVRGSVDVALAGSRMEIRVEAARSALSRTRRTGKARVARVLRSSAGPGRVSFVAKLDAAARRALRTKRVLKLSVRIVVTHGDGASYAVNRTVTLRPSS